MLNIKTSEELLDDFEAFEHEQRVANELDKLEAYERDQKIAKELESIPYRARLITLKDLIDRIERVDRVRKYVQSKRNGSKSNIEKSAWNCLDEQTQQVRNILMNKAEKIEKEIKKGGANRKRKNSKRKKIQRKKIKSKR